MPLGPEKKYGHDWTRINWAGQIGSEDEITARHSMIAIGQWLRRALDPAHAGEAALDRLTALEVSGELNSGAMAAALTEHGRAATYMTWKTLNFCLGDGIQIPEKEVCTSNGLDTLELDLRDQLKEHDTLILRVWFRRKGHATLFAIMRDADHLTVFSPRHGETRFMQRDFTTVCREIGQGPEGYFAAALIVPVRVTGIAQRQRPKSPSPIAPTPRMKFPVVDTIDGPMRLDVGYLGDDADFCDD